MIKKLRNLPYAPTWEQEEEKKLLPLVRRFTYYILGLGFRFIVSDLAAITAGWRSSQQVRLQR
jgi:hypothetical protein